MLLVTLLTQRAPSSCAASLAVQLEAEAFQVDQLAALLAVQLEAFQVDQLAVLQQAALPSVLTVQ